MATIQILGTGCSNCGYLAANAQRALQDAGRDDVIEKITDLVKALVHDAGLVYVSEQRLQPDPACR